MALCKQCGKRSIWIDNNGLCEKCHDAAYVRMMKKRAGDTSAEAGIKTVRKGLVNHYVCRLCGETIPFSEAKTIDKRTGYCASCTRRLEKMPAEKPAEKSAESTKPATEKKTVNFRIAGTTYHASAFEDLAIENDDYELTKSEIVDEGKDGEKIYEYFWDEVNPQLVPEPDNPEDPKAIAVYASGQKIGYIKQGKTAQIRKLIEAEKIQSIKLEMGGGKYKYVYEIEEDDKGRIKYDMEKDADPYWAEIFVTVRE